MRDLLVKINRNNRHVDLSKSTIGNDGENLQGNIIFSFEGEFVNGQARLEYIIEDDKKYIFLEKVDETYITPMKSLLMKNGLIDMQLVITEGTDEENIPIFKSNVFFVNCNKSINAEVEEPEGMDNWLDIANSKLNQADNLNITTTPIQGGVQIDTTSKNGETNSTEVVNGKDGKDGKDGADGYTPVKGKDYFTQSDINEIVQKVLAQIPTSEGVEY